MCIRDRESASNNFTGSFATNSYIESGWQMFHFAIDASNSVYAMPASTFEVSFWDNVGAISTSFMSSQTSFGVPFTSVSTLGSFSDGATWSLPLIGIFYRLEIDNSKNAAPVGTRPSFLSTVGQLYYLHFEVDDLTKHGFSGQGITT